MKVTNVFIFSKNINKYHISIEFDNIIKFIANVKYVYDPNKKMVLSCNSKEQEKVQYFFSQFTEEEKEEIKKDIDLRLNKILSTSFSIKNCKVVNFLSIEELSNLPIPSEIEEERSVKLLTADVIFNEKLILKECELVYSKSHHRLYFNPNYEWNLDVLPYLSNEIEIILVNEYWKLYHQEINKQNKLSKQVETPKKRKTTKTK